MAIRGEMPDKGSRKIDSSTRSKCKRDGDSHAPIPKGQSGGKEQRCNPTCESVPSSVEDVEHAHGVGTIAGPPLHNVSGASNREPKQDASVGRKTYLSAELVPRNYHADLNGEKRHEDVAKSE